MLRTTGTVFALALAMGALVGCGGAGDVGAACATPGALDECVDDAVCATDPPSADAMSSAVWDTNSCRARCSTQDDCATGTECRGVTGAAMISACQPPRPAP